MPSNVSAMRLLSKPRMISEPPAEPNGSLLVKLTPGSWLITSLIDWPGVWRWMNSALSCSRVFDVSGATMPPTEALRVPVTTIALLFSKSVVPVDWAKATPGMTKAVVAQSSAIFFMMVIPPRQTCLPMVRL